MFEMIVNPTSGESIMTNDIDEQETYDDFVIIDNYTQEAIISIIGLGEYGKKIVGQIKSNKIEGLGYKESIDEIETSDMLLLVASLDEMNGRLEEIYDVVNNTNLSYLYVRTDTNIDYCSNEDLLEMQKYFDLVIPIPQTPITEESIYWSIRGIVELVTTNGLICIDFADVSYVTKGMAIGATAYGSANQSVDDRATVATEQALRSLYSTGINVIKAKGFLVTIFGGMDMSIGEFDDAGTAVREVLHDDASVVVGTIIDPDIDRFYVAITATGVC